MVSAPAGSRPVRWGLGDAAAGWLLAQFGGLVLGSLVFMLSGVDESDDLSLGWLAVGQLGLWFGMLGVPLFAARVKGNGAVADFRIWSRRWDPALGAAVGLLTQFLVVPALYWPIFSLFDVGVDDLEQPARGLTDRATDPVGVLLLVLIVGIGAPIIEEIFYRGLLQRALARRYGPWPGVIGSALVFGLSHFQLLQLPALVALGIVLARLTDRTGRLGPAIFAHMAFNMVTVVVLVAG